MSTHYLRFGTHAENKYFLNDNSSLYDAIIFNGNMVAYTKSAIAGFIINTNEKSFLIDPQTHAFQHDPSYLKAKDSKGELQIKKSISQLADSLGTTIKTCLENGKPVTPSDFTTEDSINSLAEGTIGFQKGIIDEIKSNGDWEYLEFMLSKTNSNPPEPSGLIAPYFYMTDITASKWLEVNIKLVEASAKYTQDTSLFAQIVIAKDVLTSEDSLDSIIQSYSSATPETVLIWVDSLSEVDASKAELRGLKRLCKELTESGKKVINLYGGYFSLLLANQGYLTGVCHGLEYGENRAVVPVGGGIPMAKYYFYPLHFRMRYADLITIYNQKGWAENPKDFSTAVCDCELCMEGDIEKYGVTNPVRTRRGANIITLNYPTQETKDYSLRHYLLCKYREFQATNNQTLDELTSQLITARDEYQDILGLEAVTHIDRWLAEI